MSSLRLLSYDITGSRTDSLQTHSDKYVIAGSNTSAPLFPRYSWPGLKEARAVLGYCYFAGNYCHGCSWIRAIMILQIQICRWLLVTHNRIYSIYRPFQICVDESNVRVLCNCEGYTINPYRR